MITRTLDPLGIRKRLGRKQWLPPVEFGPDGWRYDSALDLPRARIIITASDHPDDDREWIHASISRPEMPTYDDLVTLHHAVWPDGHAYQCFVPSDEHVNIHATALHLWGLASGERVLPDFGWAGTI